MGAGKGDDVSRKLLSEGSTYPPGYIPVAAEEGQVVAADEQPFTGERQWSGGLLACCGSCDLIGLGSCLLGWKLPCIAWGLVSTGVCKSSRHTWNMNRSFRQSGWLHGLLFFLLFTLAALLSLTAVHIASHNVLAVCNGPMPHPHDPSADMFRLAGPEGKDAVSVWSKDDDDDDLDHFAGHKELFDMFHHSHEHEEDGSDGDHHGPHALDDIDEPIKKDKAARKAEKAVEKEAKKLEKAARKEFKHKKPCNRKKAKESVGESFADQSFSQLHGPAGTLAHFHVMGERRPMPPLAGPECAHAWRLLAGAWGLFIATSVFALHYAASRRTRIREQFGIAGSKLGDYCAYYWCTPCALCQETRTLWTNNVVGGVWHGPTQAGQPATLPQTAPPPQFMTQGSALKV